MELVVIGTAKQHVIAGTADNEIVAVFAIQIVVRGTRLCVVPDQLVIPASAVDGVRTTLTKKKIVAHATIDEVPAVFAQRGNFDVRFLAVESISVNDIVTLFAQECVVLASAADVVIVRPAVNDILAAASFNVVVAGATVDEVSGIRRDKLSRKPVVSPVERQ